MTLKEYLKHLSISISFYLLLAIFFFFYLLNKHHLNTLYESNFLHFDAALYQNIKNDNYYDNWLCAFFPAFPYLWKFLNISITGISLVNACIFILSISAITTLYKMNWKQELFFLSIPSLIFMFVPYTESLFFAAGTLLLIGLNKNKSGFILLGLLLGSLIRPTTFVFIPAILGTYFFTEHAFKTSLTKSILPVLSLILGLFITIYVHFYFTHKWFVFFEAQKLWKNYLHFPTLPLTSWGGDASVRYDGSAFAIAIICGVYIINAFTKKMKGTIETHKDLIFSILYIFGTTLLILAYRDGNLYSLNRFIYATPFITVCLHYFFTLYNFKLKHVWILLITSEVLWLLFGSYNHIHNLLLFSTVSLYFIMILFSKHQNKIISTFSILSLVFINCIGFIILFNRYLNNVWVG